MQSKDKNIKSICTENNNSAIVPIPAKIVAEMVDGSESMVKQVRQGVKGGKGKLCKKIQLADQLLAVGIQATIQQVTDLINQTNEVSR